MGGRCTTVDSYYMVPVVDGDDAVRVVRALGVDHIATLAAADVTEDVVTMIPQTEGFAEKLARPAKDVEMLIGMDNQGWMPVHVESSQLASDNLRLMQSVLSPCCILMGSVRMPEQGRGTQGSDDGMPAAVRKRPGGQGRVTRAPSGTRSFTTQSPSSRRTAGRQPRRGASSSMGRSTHSR